LGFRRPKLYQVFSYLFLGTQIIITFRQYWEMYYPSTNAILYVVDSKDKPRFSKAA